MKSPIYIRILTYPVIERTGQTDALVRALADSNVKDELMEARFKILALENKIPTVAVAAWSNKTVNLMIGLTVFNSALLIFLVILGIMMVKNS